MIFLFGNELLPHMVMSRHIGSLFLKFCNHYQIFYQIMGQFPKLCANIALKTKVTNHPSPVGSGRLFFTLQLFEKSRLTFSPVVVTTMFGTF